MNRSFQSLQMGWLFATILCSFAWMSSASNAAIITYNVSLSGPAESPPNSSPGIGFGQVIVDTTARTMRVNFSFSGLTGATTNCHIHAATASPFAGTAGVATALPSFVGFPSGVTAGSFDSTLDLTNSASYNPAYVTNNGGTLASAEVALLSAIDSGRAYLNLHSTTFSGGEIRGFLVAVPEPSSMLLSAFAVLGVAIGCYRKRKMSKV
jgi:hypothetical protein